MLLGAASQVGYRLLPLLECAEYTTVAVSRRGRPEWGQEISRARWVSPEDLPAAASDADILVSTGPLAFASGIAAGLSGLNQIIALSSASVLFKSSSSDRSEQRLMASLLEGLSGGKQS